MGNLGGLILTFVATWELMLNMDEKDSTVLDAEPDEGEVETVQKIVAMAR